MSGFIALHRSEETDTLQEKHPDAFLLLAQIARRARWSDCRIEGLTIGQAFVGDWKKAGIATIGKYKNAKKVLEKAQIATFKGTNKGTVATLIDQRVFSFNAEATTSSATIQQPSSNHPTTNQQPLTNKVTRKQGKQGNKSILIDDALINEVYEAYPKKVGRTSALAAITKAVKTTDPVELLGKVRAYAAAIHWQDVQFIPNPATWFNGGRFHDDPKTWEQPQRSAPKIAPRFAGIQEDIDLPFD
jgi:hypothetical protein